MQASGINTPQYDPNVPSGAPTPRTSGNEGLFGETPETSFDDFNFDNFEEHAFDSPVLIAHKNAYDKMRAQRGGNLTFKQYMAINNISAERILQYFDNYMTTGDALYGNGKTKNKLDLQRSATNPDNPNEEVYWTEDRSNFYLVNWDNGTFKTIDPKDAPFIPDFDVENKEEEEAGGGVTTTDPEEGDGQIEGDGQVEDEDQVEEDPLQNLKDLDPIGYKNSEGVRFDFVVDRNNDGIFNGVTEFLGAMNNWKEMAELDKDGNGVVEGEELRGIKVLQTAVSGVQSFVDAVALNLKIYLNSYTKSNDKDEDGDGQRTLGNYNISADGTTYRGYNTMDTMDYLNKEYGNIFNKELA